MIKLDSKDERILHELTCDGRISNAELAERLGLSPSTCLRRVQELEKNGVIKGYRTVLNLNALGTGFIAYLTIGLADHSKKVNKHLKNAIKSARQVRECHNITGEAEYLIRVEVSDLKAFKYSHTEVLGTLPQVNEITSFIVIDTAKDERA